MSDKKTETTKRELMFDLTAEERTETLEKSLKLEAKIDEKTADIKAKTASIKADIKTLKAERKDLRTIIDTGKIPKTVTAEVTYDFKGGTVTTKYKGRVYEQRKMSDSERQANLFEAKKDKKAKVLKLAKAPITHASASAPA